MIQEPIQTQQSYQAHEHFGDDTINLIDVFLVLARHLKLVIITPALICILAIIYVLFFSEPIYVSTSKFMSSNTENKQSTIMGLASQFGFANPMIKSGPQWSYEEIIMSSTMARKLLKHRFTTEKYGPQKELLQILTYGDKEPGFSRDTLEFKAIETFQGLIEINFNVKSFVYTLKVNSIEPKHSSDIANIIIKELDQVQREYNAQQSTETRVFIAQRLSESKYELEEAEVAL